MFDIDTALRELSLSEPVTILAPLVAALAALALVYGPRHLGDDAALWRRVRAFLPHVDEAARDRGFYTAYEIDPTAESVGYWHGELAALEDALREAGYRLGPLAAHKELPDGRREVGSWVHLGRDLRGWPAPLRLVYKLVAPYQTHVTLFEAPDGHAADYLITAHYEYSAYSPLVAYWHLEVRMMDIDEGVRRTALAIKEAGEPFEPTEGAVDLVVEAYRGAR